MTYKVHRIECLKCGQYVPLLVPIDSTLVPREADGLRAIPPFHVCKPKPKAKVEQPSLFDSEGFKMMKALQRRMTPEETVELLDKLPNGGGVLKAAQQAAMLRAPW